MTLPDFLLVGAPKAGTTALHVALSQHPSLFLSPVKEPKFFLTDGPPPRGGGPGDDETSRRSVWQREAYERLFAAAPPGTLCGESTTLYLRDPAAHRRIAALVPAVRLVAVLRDPVDRAHSNWTHLRSAGLEPEADFLRACALEQERARAGWGPFWRYVGLGRYGEQLESLLSHVAREQLLVLLYRDVRERPAEVLDRICAHLGVATGVVTTMAPRNVTVAPGSGRREEVVARALRAVTSAPHVPAAVRMAAATPLARTLQRRQRRRTTATPAERAALLPLLDADIRLAERLTGLDLAHWRDPANGSGRTPLDVRGRFGTAYDSIDHPSTPRRA